MKRSPERWSVNALCDGMGPIDYFCDGRPLANDARAEREKVSPVQHLLVGVAGCFALSCQAIFLKNALKDIGLEVVVTGEKHEGPDNRLSTIRVSAIFRGNVTPGEANAIVEEARPLCIVENTVSCAPRFAYETRTLLQRFPLPGPQSAFSAKAVN